MDWKLALPYLQQFATIVVVPLLVALIKSERMALDNTTQASGIIHWYKLANKAMAIIPEGAIKAVEVKADAIIPQSSTIIEAITKEDANEISDTPAPGV